MQTLRKLAPHLKFVTTATNWPAPKANLSSLPSVLPNTHRIVINPWCKAGEGPSAWYFSFLSRYGSSGSLQWRGSGRRIWGGGGGGWNGEHVLYGLIGVNALVFVGWQLESTQRFMMRHFTCSLGRIKELQLHTLITCTFSHMEFGHLAVNMLVLFFFGRSLAQVMGGKQLLNLYLVGGLTGSIADMVSRSRSAPRSFYWAGYDVPVLGASGAVNAITTLFICLFPKEIIYLNFFIPVPAFLLGLGFLLKDFSGFMKNEGNISHAAHLGGIAVGFLYFLRLRYRR